MLGKVDRPTGVSATKALNTRFRAARSLHHLPGRGKNKDNDSSNHIKTMAGRCLTPASRAGHLSKFRPNLLTNLLGTMGAEFM